MVILQTSMTGRVTICYDIYRYLHILLCLLSYLRGFFHYHVLCCRVPIQVATNLYLYIKIGMCVHTVATSWIKWVDLGLHNALQTITPVRFTLSLATWTNAQGKVYSISFWVLHHSKAPSSHKVPIILKVNPQLQSPGHLRSLGLSGFNLMPVLVKPDLPRPPLAFRLVFVEKQWLGHSRSLKLAPRLIMLPRVPLALAGRDHSDFIRSRAAVLALQLDALGARLVVDASPILAVPSIPELPAVAAANPVGKHLSRKAFPSTH